MLSYDVLNLSRWRTSMPKPGQRHVELATVFSVFLSAAIAIIGSKLSGSWTWSAFTALVAVATIVAGLEIVRHRGSQARDPNPITARELPQYSPGSATAQGKMRRPRSEILKIPK
jgi:hypothetical protein